MPIPNSIADLSATPSSNYPGGSESPSTVDDYIRAQGAIIRQVSDAKLGITATAADSTKLGGVAPTAAGLAILDDADAAAQRTTLGLGSAATKTAGVAANNVLLIDSSGSAMAPVCFYALSPGSDTLSAGANMRLDATLIQSGAGGNVMDFWAYNGGWGRTLRIGEAGQFGPGGSTYGTAGQFLSSGGPSAAPTWADAASSVTYVNVTTPPNPSAGLVVRNGTHGLGVVPAAVTLEIVCTTAELGYAVGDIVESPFITNGIGGYLPLLISKNSTNGTAVIPSGYALGVLNASTGAGSLITSANWTTRFKFRKT